MILKNNLEVKALQFLLQKPSEIVITTHLNPDGDAIGSVLGLASFLKKNGHHVTAVTPNEYPDFLQWMHGNQDVMDYSKKKRKVEELLSRIDILFILDFNDAKRAGDFQNSILESKAIKVMLDHHPFPQLPVQYQFSFTQVSSTCELVYEFIAAIGAKNLIDKSIAECLYTGIMTDTGCFSYNSSRTRTFEIVSDLLGYGIEKDEIYHRVYDNFSVDRMRLLGFCLNDKMQYLPEYQTAFISLSMDEQNRFHFTNGDSEGFVNLPLSIRGVVFSALFIERKDKVKISFRSRGHFPANAFSENHFSGGGHLNAAGGESTLSLEETLKKFMDLLPLYKRKLNGEEK